MTRLPAQVVAFALAGVLGLGVDTAALYLLMALGLPFAAARAISFVAAASFTWWFNRRLTFRHVRVVEAWWRQWLHYLAAMSLGGVVNYAVSLLAYQAWPLVHAWPVLALALGSLAGMVFNFLSARFWVFRAGS
ncbi:MAG: GtrA family protein [Hydrogenophaga sp.]|nr:GtrA family protein [Hydrogenophaga sp.]